MRLKIYWDSPKIVMVEPSGKIHTSDLLTIDGINIMDLMFMKKYIGQEVELYMDSKDRKGRLPTVRKLTKVFVNENGIHTFEVL